MEDYSQTGAKVEQTKTNKQTSIFIDLSGCPLKNRIEKDTSCACSKYFEHQAKSIAHNKMKGK